MKALIFAAGKGTRLQPFTLSHPKALVAVNRKPLLQRNIEYLQSFGLNNFVINIHHFGTQIVEFLERNENFGASIEISDERNELLETGGGLVFAKKIFIDEEDFILMNADILTDLNISNLIKFHKENRNLASLAVSDRTSSRKLLFDQEMQLQGWKNTQTGETKFNGKNSEDVKELAFSGIHCVSSEIFSKTDRTGKFSIIDLYLKLMKTERIFGYHHDAEIVDVGRPESIAEAEKYFK